MSKPATIARVTMHHLRNIPVQPPPFRKVPNVQHAMMMEIETSDGIVGWSVIGYVNPIVVDFINSQIAPLLIGEDPVRNERVGMKIKAELTERHLGRLLTASIGAVDIALWDIRGKMIGRPVHHLLGGARDQVAVYITHGAAYQGAPIYSEDELAAEAQHLVKLGNRFLKNTVGRQPEGPNPDDDYRRMMAIRDAVGPDISLAMDGYTKMTLDQAARLCRMTEELDISFFEEPILDNEPSLLSQLRHRTTIRIAAAENHKFFSRDYLAAQSVDILQPNVSNDGGYSAGVRIAALARAYNVTLGHGNGSGPHNIALQAGVPNGEIVEYHFHRWMAYNAIFEEVPQPIDGYLTVSQKPGLGLDPKPGLIKEFAVTN